MIRYILFLNILAVFVIGGDRLGLYQVQAQSVRTTILSEQDDGRKIQLKKGDVLVLKLKAQFGTGYSWKAAVYHKTRLQFVGESVEAAGKNSESGFETQIFRFKAVKAGQSRLEFEYLRVWEKEAAPLKKIRLKIQIRRS
jgi:inhibitor of cysteine peptidase